MGQPIIKSKKQHIRMWFEFYKMILDDPEYTQNLKNSKDYYHDWGKVDQTTKFDIWWKDHKRLFGDEKVQEIDRVSNHPNTLNISVPLNLPVTETLRSVRELIENKQSERLVELGLDPTKVKSKNIGFGKYETTQGVEIRGGVIHVIQLMYSIWLELDKPPINTKFCMTVVEKLSNRPRSKWIPFILSNPPTEDRRGKMEYEEDQLRQVRRYIKKGTQICKSVSLGGFPGKSKLD